MPTTFPIQQWMDDMRDAAATISDVGTQLVETHREAGEKAREVADRWQLTERVRHEEVTIRTILQMVERVLKSTASLQETLEAALEAPDSHPWQSRVEEHAELLENTLPRIEACIAEIRHDALDLLSWAGQSGFIEGSDWPERFRAAHGRLISYAEHFDSVWHSLTDRVSRLREKTQAALPVRRLQTALTRQHLLREHFRGFMRSVVEPPKDLVFHETDTFVSDWQRCPDDLRAPMVTEFNDCCQQLLYHRAGFEAEVPSESVELEEGIDASLYHWDHSGYRAFFLVDEDPVFEEISITLLRIVPQSDSADARYGAVRSLQQEFAS